MKKTMTKMALLLLWSSLLVPGIANAWEPECHVIPDDVFLQLLRVGDFKKMRAFPACTTEGSRAVNHWVGEHFEICMRARTSRPLFAADTPLQTRWDMAGWVDLEDPVRIVRGKPETASFVWRRSAFDKQVVGVDDLLPVPLPGNRHFCELAEIADSTISLADWSSGHRPGDCPAGKGPCRDFPTLGAVNSNHFGIQAAATYHALHQYAEQLAKYSAELFQDEVAARKAYPKCGSCQYDPALDAMTHYSASANVFDIALAFEGYALHYLEDLWSVGHMWSRWGSPKLSRFSSPAEAGAVSIMAGLVHGSRALTGIDDSMCSPTSKPAHWGFQRSPLRFAGAGDLHLSEVLNDKVFSEQKKWLVSCSALSIYEVLMLGVPSDEYSKLREAFPLDGCLNHFVTNASLANAFSTAVPGRWLGTLDQRVELNAYQISELAGISSTPLWGILVGKVGGFDLPLIQKYYGPVWTMVTEAANQSPDGLQLASVALPSIGSVESGIHYYKDATDFTVLSDLNVRFDISDIQQVGTKSRAITMAVSPSNCALISPASIDQAIQDCRQGKKFHACEVCESWLMDHIEVPGVRPSDCQIAWGAPFGFPDFAADLDHCFQSDPPCAKKPKKCRTRRLPVSATMMVWEERLCREKLDQRTRFPSDTDEEDLRQACDK